jgi:hypothetical protein
LYVKVSQNGVRGIAPGIAADDRAGDDAYRQFYGGKAPALFVQVMGHVLATRKGQQNRHNDGGACDCLLYHTKLLTSNLREYRFFSE